MKKLLNYIALFISVVALGFTACGPNDPTGETGPYCKVEVGEVTAASAELKISSSGIREVFYICTDKELTASEQSATYISNFGTRAKIKNDGENIVEVKGLQTLTEYKVYLVAMDEKSFFNAGEVYNVSFTTIDFEEDFVIFNLGQREVSVHVKVPETVYPADWKDLDENGYPRNHVIKWGIASLFNYVSNMMAFSTDDLMINLHDEAYGNYFTEDTTLIFDEAHSVVLDEDGQPVVDDEGGYTQLYDVLIPGEPAVIMLGEFAYGQDPLNRGGDGYYVSLFDYERFITETPSYDGVTATEGTTKYGAAQHPYWGWTDADGKWHEAYHKNCMIITEQPEPLDAKVKVSVETTTKGGTITMEPEKGVYLYCVGIVDDAVYNQLLSFFADAPGNPEDYMQYFVTSYDAMMNGVSSMYMANSGKVKINLEEMFYVLPPMSKYHICITAMGDGEGSTQSYVHEQFQLKTPTLPEPEVVITPLGGNSGNPLPAGVEEDPHLVWFNFKKAAGSPDIMEGALLCNTERAFASSLKGGHTYLDLAETNYQTNYGRFGYTPEINTAEGVDLAFSCKPDESTIFVVYAKNEEGIANNAQLDTKVLLPENNTAIAINRSIPVPAGQRVESPLFESLKGDWTATATVTWTSNAKQDENGNWVQLDEPIQVTEERKSKVTIGDLSCPETLDPKYYPLYNSQAEADRLYAELKQGIETYNERTRNYNRLYCHGFSFDVQRFVSYEDKLVYASPYDLFVSTIYGAYNIDAVFYDFGPKWYLEVDANGNLTVPFNAASFSPLSAWYTGYATSYYMVGIGKASSLPYIPQADGSFKTGHFPAELSADGNTITIKGLEYGTGDSKDIYYPNAAYEYYGNYQLAGKIISELVLTRGWSEPEQKAAPAAMVENMVTMTAPLAVERVERPNHTIKSVYTPLFGADEKIVKEEGKILTYDEFQQIMKTHNEKRIERSAARR